MVRILFIAVLFGGVAGCGLNVPLFERSAPPGVPAVAPSEDTVRPRARPTGGADRPTTGAVTVEALDTTSEAEKEAAQAAGSGGTVLGRTVASLGAPSEPGFWLKTPLVSAPAKGRVVYAKTGESAQVDLIPIDGPRTGGSRLSLPAMRLLGAPLTGLPELEVYRLPG